MKKIIFTLTLILSFCGMSISQNVIDPVLQNVMNEKSDEMIKINIILKSQMDFSKIKNRANSISDKKIRREFLVDELKTYSENKQQDIISILNAEKNSYNVKDIKCHWLSNSISCTVSRDVIYLLSKHPDIEIIGYDEIKYMLSEESQQEDKSISQQDDESISRRDDEIILTDNITMVNADKVWELGYTGKGVIVAVIDSGVNYNHADLKDHLWDGGAEFPHHGYNVFDDNNDPMDGTGHGTHCAGTICGDGTSGVHTGIAPDATLMCIKALDNYGYGSASSFNAGMQFAIEHHADILSMSLGIMNASVSDKSLLRRSCVNALELGVIAAVAAGNDGNMIMVPVPNNIKTPGNCPPPWLHPDQQENAGGLSCVVTVGAIDYFENMYENGSKGPVTWSGTEFNDYPYNPGIGLIRPDVCAPGVGVKSLDGDSNNGYNLKSGTSMATPCVAGVMALLLEKKNDITPAEICMTLETTAKKLTETKSNLYGSGLVDAFKAVTSLKEGSFTLKDFKINDEDNNGNGKLNAGETVKLSIDIYNDSEETFSNIKTVISCNNELVDITDAEAQINSIAAHEEISLTDEFEITVDKNASHEDPLIFNVDFYNEDETLTASFNLMITVYNGKLELASFVVNNDDNNNGTLEPGETADLGVIMNNIGNDIIIKVKGVLSSSDCNITINQEEAEFSSIGSESSGIAFFNITLDENASNDINIPFELKTSDYYGNENEFSGNYISACKYIFQLDDFYNDGWDGSSILVKYSNGTPTDTLTLASGGFGEYRINISSNVEVTLEWLSRSKYDAECSFTVLTESYEIIYSSPEFSNSETETETSTVLFTWLNDCSCTNEYYNMCDAVELNGMQNENKIELSWSADENQYTNVNYEIYMGTKLLETTEETNFVDESITEEGEYIYSVRMIADECRSFFRDVIINYVPYDNTTEILDIKASVYPNPSKDNFTIICNDMTKVSVFNIIGNKIMESEVKNDEYVLEGLKPGIYFVEIRTNKGNIVKRISKF